MSRTHWLLTLLLCQFTLGNAQIVLPRLIRDGAVLQRNENVNIWGKASPGERISLSFDKKTLQTTADEQGSWNIVLPPHDAGGPYEMVLRGNNEIVLKDILFGEVWLCSGQSNMELTMERLKDKYPEVIRQSENPIIRQFTVPDLYDFEGPNDDLESGDWLKANPESVLKFSGVAYFFALEMNKRYGVPVGLINAALGGSPIEAWMSESSLKEFPDSYREMQKFKDKGHVSEVAKKNKAVPEAWYQELNEKDQGMIPGSEWFRNDYGDQNWNQMKVPGFWTDQDPELSNGVVWFRKKINLPMDMKGKGASLWLGRIVDQDHVYLNGQFIGTTGYQYPPRKYQVPEGLIKEGSNTLTVRVINERGKGGFIADKPYFLAVDSDTLDLKGQWKFKMGASMSPLQGTPYIRWKPGGLYNKMIAPLLNYRIKGVLWYQGESNTNNPRTYFKTFPTLIRDWRSQWKQGDMPFIYVQLSNFMEESEGPVESDWATLRQAQLETLKVPNTGMIVTIDLGEWNDIHPLNKKEVGHRLAQQAFKVAYGDMDAETSPIPLKASFKKDRVEVSFSPGILISDDGNPLQLFELSGDDGKFRKAEAEIQSGKVVIWNQGIENPEAVRYAWSDNPVKANLTSVEGLPVSPFEFRK